MRTHWGAIEPLWRAAIAGALSGVLLSALSSPAAAAARPAGGAADPQTRVADVLRRGATADDAVLVRDLLLLGPEALPALFACLSGEGSLARSTLEAERVERLVLATLRSRPPAEVIGYVSKHAGAKATLDVHLAAALVLAELGSAQGVRTLIAIVGHLGELRLASPRVRGPLERALARLLVQDERAWDELARALRNTPRSTRELAVAAAAASAREQALDLFAALLGHSATLDLCIVERTLELHRRAGWRLEREPAALVRPLLEHPDGRVRRAATMALGTLRDGESVAALVQSLDSRDRALGRAALWSLEQLSGLKLGGDPGAWRRWHADETAFWLREGERALAGLDQRDPGRVLESVRILAEHPLQRRESSQALIHVLAHEKDEIVLAACKALERLAHPAAVPALVDALDDPDAQVRLAAWSALRATTALELAADAEAWQRLARGD